MNNELLEVGDIVSRLGMGDEHKITRIDDEIKIAEMHDLNECFMVECMIPDFLSVNAVFEVGDIESNIIPRYEFVRKGEP